MDPTLRDELRETITPKNDQEFFDAYAKLHLERFGEEWVARHEEARQQIGVYLLQDISREGVARLLLQPGDALFRALHHVRNARRPAGLLLYIMV